MATTPERPAGAKSAGKTFVLVHGGWHGGWCWRRVADLLEARGHKVYAPTLTGVCDRSHLLSPNIDLDTHIADVVNLLKWERLDNVVLCGHSYGGIVISGIAERAEAAIGSIVFLDAFMPEDGERIVDTTVGPIRDAILAAAARGEIVIPPPSAEYFKVNEKDRAWVDALCTPHPIKTLVAVNSCSGARDRIAKKAYIRARDYFHPAFEVALTKVKADPGWRIFQAPCGHDVMIDEPKWLADLLEELA